MAIVDNVRYTAHRRSHDRFAECLGFEHNQRHSIHRRWNDNHIGQRHQVADIVHKAWNMDTILQLKLFDQGEHGCPLLALARHQESYFII